MKMLISLVLGTLLLSFVGCSTTASFKVPAGSTLIVEDTEVPADQVSEYKRSPFFWSKSSGIPYRLEKDGKVIEEGKLKSHFRIASIFWPPFSLIYWPMRFDGPYDLTQANANVRPEGETAKTAKKKTK
jgi:hypothetical protein